MDARKRTKGAPEDANPVDQAEEERRMFERELVGVRPWRRGANRISSVDFEAVAAPEHRRPSTSLRSARRPGAAIQTEDDSNGMVGTAFGVSRQTARALELGEFVFEARCDLHRLHADAARRRLQQFVEDSARKGVRAALVICGRGLHSGPEGPIMVRLVAETLARPPIDRHILAFAPAPAQHGGVGAVAVLLRRASPSKKG
jgi:DNA-nicking Smr family endonuclease